MIHSIERTRTLIDGESLSNREQQLARFPFDFLTEIPAPCTGHAERVKVEADRFDVFACWGDPLFALSTRMDAVPPFMPSREKNEYVRGRQAREKNS